MIETIRLAGMVNDSIVDGPGLRFVLFTQGCPHHCDACHNPESWKIQGGEEYSIEEVIKKFTSNKLLTGITLSGGEPLVQPFECEKIASAAKAANLNVLLFSGYRYEEIVKLSLIDENIANLMDKVDILIDGKFIKEEKDLTLRFRGSRNQNIIDVPKSRETGKIVVLEEYM